MLLAGRRNPLGIDTNLGYVAVCGGSNLLTFCAGGAIGKNWGIGTVEPSSAGVGHDRRDGRGGQDAAEGPARWL